MRRAHRKNKFTERLRLKCTYEYGVCLSPLFSQEYIHLFIYCAIARAVNIKLATPFFIQDSHLINKVFSSCSEHLTRKIKS